MHPTSFLCPLSKIRTCSSLRLPLEIGALGHLYAIYISEVLCIYIIYKFWLLFLTQFYSFALICTHLHSILEWGDLYVLYTQAKTIGGEVRVEYPLSFAVCYTVLYCLYCHCAIILLLMNFGFDYSLRIW